MNKKIQEKKSTEIFKAVKNRVLEKKNGEWRKEYFCQKQFDKKKFGKLFSLFLRRCEFLGRGNYSSNSVRLLSSFIKSF